MTSFHLYPFTMHNYWRICQKYHTLKSDLRKGSALKLCMIWEITMLRILWTEFYLILFEACLNSSHAHHAFQIPRQTFEPKLRTFKTNSFKNSFYLTLFLKSKIFLFAFNFFYFLLVVFHFYLSFPLILL